MDSETRAAHQRRDLMAIHRDTAHFRWRPRRCRSDRDCPPPTYCRARSASKVGAARIVETVSGNSIRELSTDRLVVCGDPEQIRQIGGDALAQQLEAGPIVSGCAR